MAKSQTSTFSKKFGAFFDKIRYMSNLKSQNIKLLKILTRSNKLKEIKRTGWILKGVKNPESVADHSWGVSLLAMLLAEKDLDLEKLLKMTVVHDLGEIVPGDVVWKSGKKIVGSQAKKRRKELKVLQELFNGHPAADEFISLLKEFNEQKTEEAKFLKSVEKLEMALQALIYESDNKAKISLDEFFENAEKYLERSKLEPIFRELQKMRKS